MSLKIGNHTNKPTVPLDQPTPYSAFGGIQGNVGVSQIPDVPMATPEELGYMSGGMEAQIAAFDAAQKATTPYSDVAIDTLPNINMMNLDSLNGYQKLPGLNAPTTSSRDLGDIDTRGTRGYEGWRDKIYTDTTGNATIGYGHKLTAADIKSGKYANGITKEQGEALYQQDIASHNAKLYKREPWIADLNSSQQEALKDMSFNMGPAFLDKFPKAKAALMAGDYTAASASFMDSKYARQVGKRASDNARRISIY